jgi:hypothetical protein
MPVYRPVCQVLKETLYFLDLMPSSKEQIECINRVNEALRMVSRMDKRLKELSPMYNKKAWIKDHTTGETFTPMAPRME